MGERGSMGVAGVRLPRFGGENGWRWLDARPGRCYSRFVAGAGPAELGLGDPGEVPARAAS